MPNGKDAKGGPPPAGGGPPPLPAKGSPSDVEKGSGSADKAKGAPGTGVAPCKWKLHINVHSNERFWPKGAFQVLFGAVKAGGAKAGGAKDNIPPVDPAWYLSGIKMQKKDAPEVVFGDCGPKSGGVTAFVYNLKKEADWVIAGGAKSAGLLADQYIPESISNGQEHKLDLYVNHPLKVHLEFKWKDPEKKVFKFPKDFPVEVWSKDKIAAAKTDENGRVYLELERKDIDWITLKFGNGPVFFSVGEGKDDKCELKTDADRKALDKAAAKYFGPPEKWSLIESIWKWSQEPEFIDGVKAYKEDEGKIYLYKDPDWVRRIGEKDAPLTLTLDPHWQFNRFEHFDRYYGHSDHGHERVNIPPVLVDGIWVKGKDETVEGRGHWVLNEKSTKETVLAQPWIRQKTEDGKKSEKPDKDSYLMFKTDAGTYSVASDANTRKMEVVPAADKRLKPDADRLKLYDLPVMWKSKGYWSRYLTGPNKYDAKFWEDWDQPGLLKSRDVKAPMIFSLDDLILTDKTIAPLKLAKTDQLAIFYHRFAQDYNEKGNVTKEGVYSPDPKEPYYSNIERKGANFNYIADYPNWVRLVAGLASCFDAFDQRTSKDVFGARAAVAWYDGMTGAGAGAALPGWNPDTAQKYFVIGPEWGQKHASTSNPFSGPGTAVQRIGRFDMVLLRCCDRLAANELFVNMQYFRLNYNFLAAAPAGATAGSTGSTLAGAARTAFMKNGILALMQRWNGYDGASNPARAEILPQDGKAPHQGEVIYFLHPSTGLAGAHFRMDVFKSGTGQDRAFMNSSGGFGQVTDKDFKPDGGFAPNSFVLAHELGHGGSLPDEYGEWWERCNHFGPGICNNIPADPFVDEGRDFDLNASLYGGGATPYPMMTMAVEMRNRYFWHNAEYARKHVGVPMFSKHNTYPEYKVPGHPKYPDSSYTYWPIRDKMGLTSGSKHGNVDIYLHALGKERFTQALMAGGPWDGMLSVLLKIDLTVPATMNVQAVRNAIRNAILFFNQTYKTTGTTSVPTDAGAQNQAIAQGVFRFSPRFLISNVNPSQTSFLFTPPGTYAGDYAGWKGWVKTQFQVTVVDNKGAKAPVASGFAGAAGGAINLGLDSSKAWQAGLAADVQALLPDMLGITLKGKTIAAGDLTPLAAAVIDTNAKVV